MSRAYSMHISINMIPKYNAFEYLNAYPPWYWFYGLIIKKLTYISKLNKVLMTFQCTTGKDRNENMTQLVTFCKQI
jgi:hypothetical protein